MLMVFGEVILEKAKTLFNERFKIKNIIQTRNLKTFEVDLKT